MRYHGEKRVCAHTSALEGEHLGRVQGHAEGGGTGGETWFSRRIRNGAHFGAETIVCKVGGGRGVGRGAVVVARRTRCGRHWASGRRGDAVSARRHARLASTRAASVFETRHEGRESGARLLPHRFLQPRSPPTRRPNSRLPRRFYTSRWNRRVESQEERRVWCGFSFSNFDAVQDP